MKVKTKEKCYLEGKGGYHREGHKGLIKALNTLVNKHKNYERNNFIGKY